MIHKFKTWEEQGAPNSLFARSRKAEEMCLGPGTLACSVPAGAHPHPNSASLADPTFARPPSEAERLQGGDHKSFFSHEFIVFLLWGVQKLSVINQGDEFMSFAFKMKLYLNSWRAIYVFFFKFRNSSVISTFHPLAFSVGGWVMRGGEGGGRGVCVWPSPFSNSLFQAPDRVLPSMVFNKSQHLYQGESLPHPHADLAGISSFCASLRCPPPLRARKW